MKPGLLVATGAVLLALSSCQVGGAPRVAAATSAAAAPAASLEARRQLLRQLVAEQWEYTMRTSPEYASILGDKRYNDRWSDHSEKAVCDDLEESRHTLRGSTRWTRPGSPSRSGSTRCSSRRQLELNLEGAKFEDWLMPVNQFAGTHLELAELVTLLPFTS